MISFARSFFASTSKIVKRSPINMCDPPPSCAIHHLNWRFAGINDWIAMQKCRDPWAVNVLPIKKLEPVQTPKRTYGSPLDLWRRSLPWNRVHPIWSRVRALCTVYARFVHAVTSTRADRIVFAAVQKHREQNSYAPVVPRCTFEPLGSARTIRIFMRFGAIGAARCSIRNCANKSHGQRALQTNIGDYICNWLFVCQEILFVFLTVRALQAVEWN